MSTTAAVAMTASTAGNLSSILGAQEAYAFGNQIIQNEQQYNIDCMSAASCFNGPLSPLFPYTNFADVSFRDAFVNQNAFQLNAICSDASCINLSTNYAFLQSSFPNIVLQNNNQQNLGIMGPGAAAGNEGLNQALQFATQFSDIYQSNDQFNIDCVGSGCFNQAFNLASQGFSVADTIFHSNIQMNGQCLDGSLCQNYAINYASQQGIGRGNILTQQNLQTNLGCAQGSVCFSAAENTALFESSIGNTVEQSNVQSIDGCVDGSSCTNFGSNFVSISD